MNISMQLLWALIGLLLTIGATFWEVRLVLPSGGDLLNLVSLNITYQIGAVLLVGLLGGKNAGALSQIAYIVLGLTSLKIFTQGGGLNYLREPSFGYVLGFVPAAWLCGSAAFRHLPKLENLALSSLWGLLTIHGVGLLYLALSLLLGWGKTALSFWELVVKYSVTPLPSQLAVLCAVTLIGYVVRQIMFY